MTIYTLKDLAELLKVSDRTVRRAAESGVLSGARIGNKWRFTEGNLEEYLQLRTPALTEVVKRKRERLKRKNLKLIELSTAERN